MPSVSFLIFSASSAGPALSLRAGPAVAHAEHPRLGLAGAHDGDVRYPLALGLAHPLADRLGPVVHVGAHALHGPEHISSAPAGKVGVERDDARLRGAQPERGAKAFGRAPTAEAASSRSAYIARSTAPLGELCSTSGWTARCPSRRRTLCRSAGRSLCLSGRWKGPRPCRRRIDVVELPL